MLNVLVKKWYEECIPDYLTWKKKSYLGQTGLWKVGFFISFFLNCSDGLNVNLNANLLWYLKYFPHLSVY